MARATRDCDRGCFAFHHNTAPRESSRYPRAAPGTRGSECGPVAPIEILIRLVLGARCATADRFAFGENTGRRIPTQRAGTKRRCSFRWFACYFKFRRENVTVAANSTTAM